MTTTEIVEGITEYLSVYMKKGKREGQRKTVDSDGNTIYLSNWENGLRSGESIQFGSDGEIEFKWFFIEGNVVSRELHNPDGTIEVIEPSEMEGSGPEPCIPTKS